MRAGLVPGCVGNGSRPPHGVRRPTRCDCCAVQGDRHAGRCRWVSRGSSSGRTRRRRSSCRGRSRRGSPARSGPRRASGCGKSPGQGHAAAQSFGDGPGYARGRLSEQGGPVGLGLRDQGPGPASSASTAESPRSTLVGGRSPRTTPTLSPGGGRARAAGRGQPVGGLVPNSSKRSLSLRDTAAGVHDGVCVGTDDGPGSRSRQAPRRR